MKKLLTILFIIMLLITVIQIRNVYALYKNSLSDIYKTLLGVWSVKVNETDLSSGEANLSFEITEDYLKYNESNVVAANCVAPGTGGYFDILIDPTNTDVAVKYEITVGDITTMKVGGNSQPATNIDFHLTSVEDSFEKGAQKDTTTEHINKISDDYKSLSGVIPLNVIQNEYQDRVRVYFEWSNNEANNTNDTNLGTKTEQVELIIPVNLKLTQYMGEAL